MAVVTWAEVEEGKGSDITKGASFILGMALLSSQPLAGKTNQFPD